MEVGQPWARITPDDHSGSLYVVTFLGLTYSSLTFLARLLIKWNMLGLDDGAMLVAQVASVIQFGLLLASLSAGLAKSLGALTDQQYSRMSSTYAGAQSVIYISLGFSKIACILLVRRLFTRDMKNAWALCNIIIGIVIAWTLASAVLVSAGCTTDSLSPKTPSEICPGIKVRYLFVVITDGITDLLLAVTPTYLCRHLQMNVFFKLQVLVIFALRLPVPALASLFYKAWASSLQSGDPGVERTTALIYQQCQLCVSLIATTIPCMKSFIQSFDTGSGQGARFGYSSNYDTYGHRSSVHHSDAGVNGGESYQMSRLDRGQIGTSTWQDGGKGQGAVRVNKKTSIIGIDPIADNGSAELERRSSQESDRNSQQSTQELVIRKDMHFNVKREPAKKGSEAHRPGLLRLPK